MICRRCYRLIVGEAAVLRGCSVHKDIRICKGDIDEREFLRTKKLIRPERTRPRPKRL